MRLFWSIALVYVTLVALGYINFELWDQVEYIHSQGEELLDLVTGEISPHLSRYLLVYPLYFLQDMYGVSSNYLFSLLCAFMVVLIAWQLVKVPKGIDYICFKHNEVVILLFFIGVSLMMHGRIIFALLGFTLMIREVYNASCDSYEGLMRNFVVICLAIWMSSVSSGTFSVVYLFLVYFVVFQFMKTILYGRIVWRDLKISLVYTFVLYAYFSLLVMFLEKNITYFSGFWNMLEHGLGKLVLGSSIGSLILLELNMLVLLGVLFLIWFHMGKMKHVLIALCIGFFGGLFGYSTLVMATVPGVLLVVSLDFKQDPEAKS